MLLEKGRISNFQLSALIIGFVFGSSVIISPGGDAGHDAWIAVSIGLMESLLIAWIFTSLAKQFKNKTIIEIVTLVYGNILGKCISALFIWYLFHLSALVLNNYIRFFNLQIYPATPKTVGLLLLILVCASTVGRGIEVLARCGLILVTFTIIIAFADTLLLIPNFNINNLMPVLDVPAGKLLWAAHGAASFPFAETVAFLMVLPFVVKPEKGPSTVTKSLLIAGFILIMIAVRNAAVLGQLATILNYPSYMSVQVINIGDFLNRLEILVAINLITMGFIKISVLLYGTALGFAQILNLRSYQPFIVPIGILMVILALANVGNTVEMIEFANKGYRIYSIPFQIGIPLITLVVAKLRKLPKKGGVNL